MNETVRTVSDNKLIQGMSGGWEVVIGMEIHAQILARSKLFSGASTVFGSEPNNQVSLVDAAMPGMLPILNDKCVQQAIRTGLGLKAKINLYSVFERKHYFYPDLPQGYQISQYEQPLIGEGVVVVDMPDGNNVAIGIERLHLEQDAGKLIHDMYPTNSCVDLNRSGVALMEIVSKPDIRSSDEAKAYLMKLRSIMRYLGTCDGSMEQGSLRCDVNLSVHKPGSPFGTACEIKNINSIRFIGQAIDYEARRQISVLEEGGKIIRETRLFDHKTGKTRTMRVKEDAHDYRYFPDPDLLPLKLDQAYVDEIAASIPELPDEKKARFINFYGLSPYDADVLVADHEVATFFEEVVKGRDAKLVTSWLINELFGLLNKENLEITKSFVSSHQLGVIIDLVSEGVLSGKIAKDLLEIVWLEGGDPREIAEKRSMQQVTDMTIIGNLVDEVISANASKASQVKMKPGMLGWFVGQVMAASNGKANPQVVNDLLRKKIGIE